jgi:hypothetical protein
MGVKKTMRRKKMGENKANGESKEAEEKDRRKKVSEVHIKKRFIDHVWHYLDGLPRLG